MPEPARSARCLEPILLTPVFPVILADALDCALTPEDGVVPEVTTTRDFKAAEAS
jgi:hypothetical protein